MKNNYYNLLKTNLKLILKFLFQSVCMLMMIYQIIIVTMDFIAFPTEVSVDVIQEENYTLPSVSICTQRELLWNNTVIDNDYPE